MAGCSPDQGRQYVHFRKLFRFLQSASSDRLPTEKTHAGEPTFQRINSRDRAAARCAQLALEALVREALVGGDPGLLDRRGGLAEGPGTGGVDRKSTRLNSSH